jgi:hypothetical protein
MLIDSDIFIDHLRKHEPATRFLESLKGRSDVCFSAVTETELFAGTENEDPQRHEQLRHLLLRWTKLSLGNPVAAFAGDIRREHGLAFADAIIAATARAHNAELITRNTKDYRRVPELRIRAPY